ncbi:enoyl-CoA hydratase [Sphingobium jiangsuense]|uniref:Enoyl-CoA hydratase/carnithine racemase n=1 Tax=Sphingobium jiangsuense TaxID=870476 RepID=A0A7W6BRQ6_9SPHN|nr:MULTISPECIES: crotonase/enoyl-CoA hydratase family protein [Sphingobium]MBB3928855.1 enoyl-CoA hydratase/carnithine racemase [Sphingobium jiangsuense]WRD78500.1 crotonase/enoyl-CoA hydratase family protein [Sphingobium baderi]GLT02654.1 enoyl-CoA hydratase [Sphingobium jiangsuense]
MSGQVVTYELDGNIAKIGLNRPAKRNALSSALLRQLEEAINRAGEEARVGLLFSHNEHFSGGMDLAEAQSWVTDHSRYLDMRVGTAAKGRPHDHLARGRIPFVAAISGACVGGGLELATSCHVRVGDETSFFALPEGQRGFYIGGGGSVRIARLLGVARMTDMMLTGRVLSAEEGERYNLLQYCVPKGEHIKRATSLAHRIAENAPLVNWAVVHGLPRIQDCSYDDGLFIEGVFSQISMGSESAERIEEFVSGRARPLVKPGRSGDEHGEAPGTQS